MFTFPSVDDLSMLVATSAVMHQVFTFDKSPTYTLTFGLALTTVMTIFSIWHCVVDETTCHSILFGIMMLIILFKTRAIIHARVPDPAVRAQVKNMSAWSTGQFQWSSCRLQARAHIDVLTIGRLIPFWILPLEHRSALLRSSDQLEKEHWYALELHPRVPRLVAYIYWNWRLYL